MSIVGTAIAYGVKMTRKLSNQYDLGVKGEGQIYSKSVLRLVTCKKSSFILIQGVIYDTMIFCGV